MSTIFIKFPILKVHKYSCLLEGLDKKLSGKSFFVIKPRRKLFWRITDTLFWKLRDKAHLIRIDEAFRSLEGIAGLVTIWEQLASQIFNSFL